MRVFTVNEDLWGPLKKCECGAESECIVLSDAENSSLPSDGGGEAVSFIYRNKLGIDVCGECAQRKIKESQATYA
jgi:hypothetical protein